jgi:hypothetical protein
MFGGERMTTADVEALVRDDMRVLSDARVLAHVSSLLLTPPRPQRVWVPRYSGEVYEGFLVLSHPSGAAVAYSPRDYDLAVPWGLVGTPNEPPSAATWCYDWYPRFLDVYFESLASTDLAIWRVREWQPGRDGAWVSGELSWREAWEQVSAMRASAPHAQYYCDHSIMY